MLRVLAILLVLLSAFAPSAALAEEPSDEDPPVVAGPAAPAANPSDAVCLQRGAKLYSHGFLRSRREGWATLVDPRVNMSISYTEDAYQITLPQKDGVGWSGPPDRPEFGDAVVETRARLAQGHPDGIVGLLIRRSRDDAAFYELTISGTGEYRIRKSVRERWVDVTDWAPSPAINVGDGWNTITVVARGNTFAFCVNGSKVTEVSDDSYKSGRIGILAGSKPDATNLVQALFESLDVYALP